MFYYIKKGKNATETQCKICAVNGEGAVIDQKRQKWFAKFRARDFSLDVAPQSDRTFEIDNHWTETLTENNQGYTTWGRADILKKSKLSVKNYLHKLGYVNHFDMYVSHKRKKKTFLTIFPQAIL